MRMYVSLAERLKPTSYSDYDVFFSPAVDSCTRVTRRTNGPTRTMPTSTCRTASAPWQSESAPTPTARSRPPTRARATARAATPRNSVCSCDYSILKSTFIYVHICRFFISPVNKLAVYNVCFLVQFKGSFSRMSTTCLCTSPRICTCKYMYMYMNVRVHVHVHVHVDVQQTCTSMHVYCMTDVRIYDDEPVYEIL